MARTEKLSRENIIHAVWASRGHVSVAAQALGCSARTIYNYAAKYATVQRAIEEARETWDETVSDICDAGLAEKIKVGYWPAMRYWLDNKMRLRGFGSAPGSIIAESEGPTQIIIVKRPDDGSDLSE